MHEAPTAVKVFCFCADADEYWLLKLETHLNLLVREGSISLWHNRRITPGTNWAADIKTHIDAASVILLLVSASFFQSDDCYSVMERAVERQEAGDVQVIPILVHESDWQFSRIAYLPVLPTGKKALSSCPHEEEALDSIVKSIRHVIVDNHPLQASSTPHTLTSAVQNIPYPQNPFFLGRDTELTQLHDWLQPGQVTALSQWQAISGLGGIGKTQVALEYAYRYGENYTAVLWVQAESAEALISSYVSIAKRLQLQEDKEQDRIVQAVKTWLQEHRDWLLILDNADDLQTLFSDFLPLSLRGHVLLTTRAEATGKWVTHQMKIGTLLPEQGAVFLLRRSKIIPSNTPIEHASLQEQTLAIQISQELGGLPLALDQAGAYLEKTGCSLIVYQQTYQQSRTVLLGERGGGGRDDHPESVAVMFSLSFQNVERKNPDAAKLLRLCAYLAPDAIPEEILKAGAPVETTLYQFNEAIAELRAYSLVQRDRSGKTFSIHRLVQAVLQDTLEKAERRTWREQAILAVNAAFPHTEHGTWSQCERLLTQALMATQAIKQYQVIGEEAERLLHETASYLLERARYSEAEPLFQLALRIREQRLEPQHLDVAASLNGLANLYYQQGKYAEAEPLFQRALRIREQHLEPQYLDVAASLNNLAALYSDLGKYEEAGPLCQRALLISEQQLGPEHPNLVRPLNNLALLYYRQGKYEEAEPLYQRALLISEQQLGPGHPNLAHPLNGLANLYSQLGKYGEAERYYRRTLDIWQQQLGPQHPLVATLLYNLAALYSEQGKYEEAEPLYQQALQIWEQQSGPQHPNVAHPLNGLAYLYSEQGKYEKAEPLYQQALQIWEQQLGPEHRLVASPVNNLALLYYQQGRYAEAERHFQRALRIYEQQLGLEHPNVAHPLAGLADLCVEQGRYEEAEMFYQRALHIREQVLGSEHPTVAETIHGLARIREVRGNREEAKFLYARALTIREQALGAHHLKTAETRVRLIALLHTMEQHEEAAKLEATQAEP